jgi:hypothetical protein
MALIIKALPQPKCHSTIRRGVSVTMVVFDNKGVRVESGEVRSVYFPEFPSNIASNRMLCKMACIMVPEKLSWSVTPAYNIRESGCESCSYYSIYRNNSSYPAVGVTLHGLRDFIIHRTTHNNKENNIE